jgi:hypothetical protein
MSYPNVEATLHQDKRKTSLSISQTDPYLAIHQKTMMKVDDALPHASTPIVDLGILFAFLPG